MAITIAQWLVRIAGVLALLLGLLLWAGDAPASAVPLHMLLGLITVLALWVLAVLARGGGVPTGLVAAALVWGLLTVLLGLNQATLLPGGAHWVVQAVHLVLGMGAVGLGETIGGRLRRARLGAAA